MTGPALLYLIGPPAAGKSTLMAALTAGCVRVPLDEPFKHDVLADPRTGLTVAAEIGRARPGFPGTDTLPLNVSPRACHWVRRRPHDLLLAEGDRLAHVGFLQAAADAGYRVMVVHLSAPDDVLDERCAQRGSRQTAPWRAGRATKAARLADWSAQHHRLIRADTTDLDPLMFAVQLRATLPALYALPSPALT